MKKFLILFIILVLFGSGIFYLGWIQYRLEPGESALVFSKTNGWEDSIIEAGNFEWRWQALLPTNLRIFRFRTSSFPVSYRFQEIIPGSSVFAEDLDSKLFTLGFTVDLRIALTTEGYKNLIVNQGPEVDEELFLTDQIRDENIETLVLPSIQSIIDIFGIDLLTDLTRIDTIVDLSRVAIELQEHLGNQVNYQILDFAIKDLVIPNSDLYRTLADRYLAISQASLAGEAEVENQLARERAIEQARVKRMENYGEILERYPTILEYLRIVGETNIDPLEMTGDQ
ncbi:MAG: hypothetical protein GW949_00645 [Spirochaetales bacterium]|nr:hypothetical protein [Spirochaetales bacterium]